MTAAEDLGTWESLTPIERVEVLADELAVLLPSAVREADGGPLETPLAHVAQRIAELRVALGRRKEGSR